jgi:ATP-dependent DNA helicase 2 subunit 1
MEYFEKEVGSSDQIHLGNVFWATSQLLSGKKQMQRSRKVFMMTNNCDPSPNDNDACSLAATRYKDLQENDISLFLLPLTDSFDVLAFHQKYLNEDTVEEDVNIYKETKELIKAISTFESRARTVFKVPFILGNGLTCGIKGCYRIIEAKKPLHFYLEEKTNQEVETITTYNNAETGGILKKEEISYSFEYGGIKAVFSKDEIQKMKYFGNPALILHGFYPVSWLKLKYNLNHSVFLFPDEEAYIGSSCLISNLAEGMKEKNVLAIAALISSPRATPRFLALLPSVPATQDQEETVSIGFHGIYLPYKEDVRTIDSSLAPVGKVAAKEVTSSMKSIVESLTLPGFSCESYSNPELSLFYAGLVSMAQEDDEMELVNDDIRPNLDWINREAGDYIRSCNKVYLQ